MPSIVTTLGLASYNPYKEAISIALAGIGPYLIDKLTLEPTNTVSKIGHIRKTFFGIRTQFLQFTQKNSLTKYTWVFLKNIPTSLTISQGFGLAFYLIIKIEERKEAFKDDIPVPLFINCIKYLVFLLFLGANIKDDLDPPKKRSSEEMGGLSRRKSSSYYLHRPNTLNFGGKDSRRASAANLGGKAPITPSSPGGYKDF